MLKYKWGIVGSKSKICIFKKLIRLKISLIFHRKNTKNPKNSKNYVAEHVFYGIKTAKKGLKSG